MGRAPVTAAKDGLNRGAWTAAEDQILRDYVKDHGEGKWGKISKETGLKRCGKSCRLRWLNYLRPNIKRGSISQDEEDLIVRLHKLLGNRWSLIAGRLPGRTDNEIKNYWNTTLRKKAQAANKEEKIEIPTKKKPSDSNDETAPSDKTKPGRDTDDTISSSLIPYEHIFGNTTSVKAPDHVALEKKKRAESDSSEEENFGISCYKNEEASGNNFMMDVNEEQISLLDFLHTDFAKLLEGNYSGSPNSSSNQSQLFSDESLLGNWTSEDDFLFE